MEKTEMLRKARWGFVEVLFPLGWIVFALLVSVALFLEVEGGLKKTFGPFSDPVRYSWNSGRKCVVIYSDKREVPCTKFTREELNQFRLEYTDPHRQK